MVGNHTVLATPGVREPVRNGTFHGHDGVSTGRNHGAGHDGGGGAALKGCGRGTCRNRINHPELRTAVGHVCTVDGEAVHLGVRERREAQGRRDVVGQALPQSVPQRQSFRPCFGQQRSQQFGDGGAVPGNGPRPVRGAAGWCRAPPCSCGELCMVLPSVGAVMDSRPL